MSLEHPKAIGLAQYLLFPLLALTIQLVGYTVTRPAPVSTVAWLYPISLILLSIYPPLIAKFTILKPSNEIVQFAKGASLAATITLLLAILSSIIATFAAREVVPALGLLCVGAGSLSLPTALAAAGYGRMFASSETGLDDFLGRLAHRHMFEATSVAYLGLYLSNNRLMRLDTRAAVAIWSSFTLYIFGWVIVGIAGGYPFILFGIVILLAYLLLAGLEVRRWVPLEKRQQVSDLITSST